MARQYLPHNRQMDHYEEKKNSYQEYERLKSISTYKQRNYAAYLKHTCDDHGVDYSDLQQPVYREDFTDFIKELRERLIKIGVEPGGHEFTDPVQKWQSRICRNGLTI